MKKDIVPIPRKSDAYYMRAALRYAKKAAAEGEVPVGAVVVYGGRIVAGGRNRRETKKNALCHAELEAIGKACRRLGGWRLFDCDLYVTLEPCPMCAGAILNARIDRVFIGAKDKKSGCFGSIADLNALGFNHTVEVVYGVVEDDCAALLRDFFAALRKKTKKESVSDSGPEKE